MVLEVGIFVAVAFVALVLVVYNSVYLIRQAEVVVIERFGRSSSVLTPGIHIIIPFIDKPRKVLWSYIIYQQDGKKYQRFSQMVDRIDMREAVYDFPKQNVITRDNVTMEINALLYYQITDPKAAVYEVYNLPEAIEKITQTTLRNVIGSMDLDETLVSRDQINQRLRIILDEATDKWGIKINRVELQEVNPPIDIRHAMEKQMRAERDRRAIILEAEGTKRSTVLIAEGQRESAVLKAQGEAESKMIAAEAEANARLAIIRAEAQAIEEIKKSIGGADPLPYLLGINYLKTLPEMTNGKDNKLIILPYESAALGGSVASIKKLFDQAS